MELSANCTYPRKNKWLLSSDTEVRWGHCNPGINPSYYRKSHCTDSLFFAGWVGSDISDKGSGKDHCD